MRLLHQWPKQEEEENTLPGLQGMVITVYQSLTLTSAHSRLRFQSGGALQGKGRCLLLIWPLQYSLFFGGFFPPSTLLLFLCDTARGGNMTPAAQPGTLQSGWVFFTLSSIATARLTENMYKFCSILGRCDYKVSFLIANSVCHLIVKCFKTTTETDRPGQKPKGSSPLS